jgi:hypothetical protein
VKRSPLKRTGGLKRKRKERWSGDLAAAVFWHDTVIGPHRCVMPGEHFGPIQGHHVITKSRLKREGLSDAVWDVRNGVPVCELHHAQHHAHRERLPRELLPAGVFEFAADYGLGWVLDREYPEQEQEAA